MAMSSWMLKSTMLGPQSRRFRFKPGKWNKEEDLFTSCLKQDPHDCFKNILSKICERDAEEEVLINHLNTFVKLLLHYDDKFHVVNFSKNDILACLRVSLVHESTLIRSAGLRAVRHTVKNENDIVSLYKLLIQYLISRSFDIMLVNDIERVEAVKLMRKILILSPSRFDISMVRSLVALANEGTEGKDRMLRVCLATLSEIGVLNPDLFIESCAVAAITRNLIECQTPKIAESLCGVLLLLLDKPQTRCQARIDLHGVAAPFCDFEYKHGWKDKNKDERELRLNCSRMALLTILRSWPGILHFCSPNDQGGFKAIVDVMYLNQREVRKAVLDLLYDLLGLPHPEWTDEICVAVSAVDPCEPQSSWRLKEGFVAAEARAVLPHLARTTPCTTDMHLALLLHCFLENGLLGALTEVITTGDTFISVRATVLLGELLRLTQLLLPPGCCNLSPSLPALLEYATKSQPQAMAAFTALQQLHKLMKKRPASYSLHLDYIIRNNYSKKIKQRQEKGSRHRRFRSRINQVKSVLRDGDDIMKETGVLSSNDALTWDWGLIKIILKGEHNKKIDLTDSSHRTFAKRLLDFFTPSQNKYSHMDLGTTPAANLDITTSGIELVNYLVDLKDPEYQSMVLDLFKDILDNIIAIKASRSVHDCLFSPQHMVNTQCQSYFLFIGQFARSETGMFMLNNIEMFTILKDLATTTNHDCYVKLIISSLDYINTGPCRSLFEEVLTCNVESSRVYATQFFLVLLRAGCPNFANWAVKLLVKQLEDTSRTVFLSALSTLHEACELPECLDALIDINPNFTKLGEKGTLLKTRLLSTEKGFKKIGRERTIEEIKKWDTHFCYRYVKLVEGDISDALTLHQRNQDGKYDKRVSSVKSSSRKDMFLPPHLYGQLNHHAEGFQLLISNGSIHFVIEQIKQGKCEREEDIINLKSALWTVGHMSTSNRGLNYLSAFSIVESMINLATKSPVYSIRSTAFYALGLVATTSLGADELCLNGWFATRHDRHDYWPVIQEELQDTIYLNHFATTMSEEPHFSENPFVGDYEHPEEDDIMSDGEDKIEFLASPTVSPDIRKVKQWTLPASRTPSEVLHKRSLSESKTFDTSNGFEDMKFGPYIIIRHRNSSMTESTTSGVSSCDSLQNRQLAGVNYLQTLSPIPSSTSLSTLKLPPSVKRQSHRVSSNSAGSDASSSSLTGSTSNELSIQNMLGYQTIRIIRRRDSLNFHRAEKDDYLFKPPPQTSRRSLTVDSIYWQDQSSTPYSAFATQKVVPTGTLKHKDKVYMGICLPRILESIFPDDTDLLQRSISKSEGEIQKLEKVEDTNDKVRSWRHSKENCFGCSSSMLNVGLTDFIEDQVKIDILAIAERLANPVMNKQFKTQLVRLKQKEPRVFKDVCIYSEVCKMFAENSYTLLTRRIVHELFFDTVYDKLYDTPKKLLGISFKSNETTSRRSTINITSPTEFKTLDSLKLISAENKFPIRTRKNTN